MVKSSTLAVAALAATSASALNTFRHKHEKKGISARHHPVPHQYQARALTYLHTETETVTEWETVYLTLGDEPTTAPTANPTTPTSPTVIATPSSSSSVEVAAAANSPAVVVADVQAEGATEPTTTTPVYVAPSTVASTSPAAAATSAASSSGSSSSSTVKRGLAYNSAAIAKTFVSTGSFSWAYDWGCTNNAQASLGVEYAPMLWGNKNDMVSLWAACAQANIDAGATHLLSFNEPDGYNDPVNQAQMSAADAAQLHIDNMNPFNGSAKIGAPAITSSVDIPTTSVGWLSSFFDACNERGGCTVDFCPVHWYGNVATGADAAVSLLKEFLTKAASTCNGKPLWLTEYGPLDSAVATESQIADFITKSVEMLDSFDGLDRYSYFFVDGALSTNQVINSLGQTYASS